VHWFSSVASKHNKLCNRAMCAANYGSLEVSFAQLCNMQHLLGYWLADAPREMLEIFDEVLRVVVADEFPHYFKVVPL
jgi:DNA replication licensing factor MCM2